MHERAGVKLTVSVDYNAVRRKVQSQISKTRKPIVELLRSNTIKLLVTNATNLTFC